MCLLRACNTTMCVGALQEEAWNTAWPKCVWPQNPFFFQGTSHMTGIHREDTLGTTVLDSQLPLLVTSQRCLRKNMLTIHAAKIWNDIPYQCCFKMMEQVTHSHKKCLIKYWEEHRLGNLSPHLTSCVIWGKTFLSRETGEVHPHQSWW